MTSEGHAAARVVGPEIILKLTIVTCKFLLPVRAPLPKRKFHENQQGGSRLNHLEADYLHQFAVKRFIRQFDSRWEPKSDDVNMALIAIGPFSSVLKYRLSRYGNPVQVIESIHVDWTSARLHDKATARWKKRRIVDL